MKSNKWYGDKFLTKLNRILVRRVMKAGVVVQTSAKSLVPVKTGNLRKSIEVSAPFVEKGGRAITVTIGTNVEYAPHIEFGTQRGLAARPYLRPALRGNRKKIIKILKGKA